MDSDFRFEKKKSLYKARLAAVALLIALSLTACTKATPEFEVLDSVSLPGPSFSGKTDLRIQISSPNDSIDFSGTCQPYSSMEWSFEGGGWSSVEEQAASFSDWSCGDGVFTLHISDISSVMNFTSPGQVKEIKIRSVRKTVSSLESVVYVEYLQPNTAPTLSITHCSNSAPEDSFYSCVPIISDAENDQVQILTAPAHTCDWLNIDVDGEITGTPNDSHAYQGSCMVAIYAYDGRDASDVTTFTLGIPNEVPTLSIADADPILEGSGPTVVRSDADVEASDEGYGGSYSLGTASFDDCASFGSVTLQTVTGEMMFHPMSGWNGNCSIEIIFSDAYGAVVVDEFAVVVKPLPKVEPLYSSAPDWNDYVANDGTTAYNASGDICTGAEVGNYLSKCIHGGEKKKVIFQDESNCLGLELSDALGAFDWECSLDGGTVVFYSQGLKAGKGLAGLIQPGGWKTNFVELRRYGSYVISSAPEVWWANSVQALPENDNGYGSTGLPTAGTIYYTDSDLQTVDLQIANDKISIVTLNGATIFGKAGNDSFNSDEDGSTNDLTLRSLIYGKDRKFLWIEARLDGRSQSPYRYHSAITAGNWVQSRIHKTFIHGLETDGSSHYAIKMKDGNGNLLSDVSIYRTSGGIDLSGSSYNILKNIKVADVRGDTGSGLIRLQASADYNRFYNLNLANLNSMASVAFGLFVGSSHNIFVGLNISNLTYGVGKGEGITVANGASDNIFSQVLITGTKSSGLSIKGGSNNIFTHVTTANNYSHSIYFNGTNINSNLFNSVASYNTRVGIATGSISGSGNQFSNMALIQNSNNVVTISGSNFASFSGYLLKDSMSCLGTGTNLDSLCIGSGLLSRNLGFIPSPFLADVNMDDGQNPADMSGLAPFSSLTSIESWTEFENPFRAWGILDGLPARMGSCANSGNCQIYDWQLNPGSELHNVSGNGEDSNEPFMDGNDCPSAVDGTEYLSLGPRSFLKNALEITGDDQGNENGLCETGESCFYAPNIGADQGQAQGSYLTRGTCNFQSGGGAVSGVTMYAYPTN